MSGRFHSTFAAFATLVVLLAVAWGFVLVGSPMARRLERLDVQRLQDLQQIAREVHELVVEPEKPGVLKAAVPQSLEEVAARARFRRIKLRDPETGEPYSYEVKGESTIELCATFTLPRDSDLAVFWNHSAGKSCFVVNLLDPPPFDLFR